MIEEKLRVRWSKKENDFIVFYTNKRDGGFVLNHIFSNEFIEKLEQRGYDKATMKFEIKLKPQA